MIFIPGFEAGEPELTIRIKPEAVARFGLTPQNVNDAIYMALWGQETTNVMEGIKLIPVRMRYPQKYASHFEEIQTLPLYFPEIKRTVTLNEIADVEKVPGKTDIEHENLSQVVNIEAQISGRDLGSTAADIQQLLHSQHFPPGVTVELSGQYESQQQAFQELLMILILAALIIFIILLFEFNSFRTALAILIGTSLSVSGVFLFLWLSGTTLDISAFMGMIMIIGVVVNNGILLIDYTEKYLKENPSIYGSAFNGWPGSFTPHFNDHFIQYFWIYSTGFCHGRRCRNVETTCHFNDWWDEPFHVVFFVCYSGFVSVV